MPKHADFAFWQNVATRQERRQAAPEAAPEAAVPQARLSKRQQEAFDWLVEAGKASEKAAAKAGFSARTFKALADAGVVKETTLVDSAGRSAGRVYRPA